MDKGSYQIIWSSEALENLKNIAAYLSDNWNEKIVNNFFDEVDKKLNVLKSQPFIGQPSVKDISIRSIILSRHNRIYYSVYENTIELLRILDMRQNPTKNPY